MAGATFSPMLSASAGQAHGPDHPETVSADRVLEANPDGRQEVPATPGDTGIVGDRNGGGKSFVFSVEGPTPTGETGIIEDILENPADYYVNVHNATFPTGARFAFSGQMPPLMA